MDSPCEGLQARLRRVLALPNARPDLLGPLLDSLAREGVAVAAGVPSAGRLDDLLMQMDLAGKDYAAAVPGDAPRLVVSDDHFPPAAAALLSGAGEVLVTGCRAAATLTALVEAGAALRFSEGWSRRALAAGRQGWVAEAAREVSGG